MGTRRTVGSAVVELLAEHGVEIVFGIPGVQTLEFFRGIQTAGMRLVLTRNEVGAAFAADGYARVTGRAGVALLISGPGLTNAATAVAQARHDSVPMLIVSSAPPTATCGRAWGSLHELPDQLAFMSSLTRSAQHVDDPALLPDAIAHAFARFDSQRPGPVHLEIPADVLAGDCPPLSARPVRATPPEADRHAVRAAATRLAAAERPMILAGGGAVDGGDALARLAEAIGAPTALTLNGKGALSDRHPLSVSTTLPCRSTLDALRAADVVLAVGTELSEVDTYYADVPLAVDGELLRVDIDRGQLQDERFPPAVPLHGDAARTLGALAARVAEQPACRDPGEGTRRAAEIRAQRRWWERAQPLLGLVEALDDAIPRDAVVACDSTQLAYVGQNAWTAVRPRSWLIPSGWGTLGCALPMAVGAGAADPERPVVAVVGDGGLLFTAGELATAAAARTPLIVMLWSNGGYQEMKDEFEAAGIPPIGVEAAARDYLAIATGFGWVAHRIDDVSAIAGHVATAVDARRPVLLELTPELL
jgi:acetolactate synthase-1/2/3 large subunit